MKHSLTLIAFALCFVLTADLSAQPQRQLTPEQQAAQQAQQEATRKDHQRMLDLLGIKALRPGASGSNPQAPNFANYDEAKVQPYGPLPDPLVMKNGKKVTSAKMWNQRRAELFEDFDREMYGRLPKAMPKVNWEVTSTTNEEKYGHKVITKQLIGHVDNSSYPSITVNIQLALTTPANAKEPVPVIVEYGFIGPRPGALPVNPNAQPQYTPWQQQVLEKGWGYATLVPGSIQSDNGAGLTQGIIGLVNKGQPRKSDDWGALRAWGWGLSRAIDYFETDKAVNAKMIALEGHSRYGKATIVAMAYEPRLAIAFVSSSGAGGAKIHRRNSYGEMVENVAAPSEYHWMAGNYLKYAGPLTPNDLPVDAHELVALCAPRPVFISGGSTLGGVPQGDGWVIQRHVSAGVHAGPVYKLLGKKPMTITEFPPVENICGWRCFFPSTHGRAYARAELAYVFDVRQSLFQIRHGVFVARLLAKAAWATRSLKMTGRTAETILADARNNLAQATEILTPTPIVLHALLSDLSSDWTTNAESVMAVIQSSRSGSAPAELFRHVVLEVAERTTSDTRVRKVMEVAARHPAAREAQLSRVAEVQDQVAAAFKQRCKDEVTAYVLAGLTFSALSLAYRIWFAKGNKDIATAVQQVFAKFTAILSSAELQADINAATARKTRKQFIELD
ncbi:MAG: hypothetical protein U0Y68_16385 [Blastocatellia bacterium]